MDQTDYIRIRPAALHTRNLEVTYEVGGSPIKALQRNSLTIEQGTFVVLLGASGAGKSTLLRTLNGLVRPTSGNVIAEGIGDITGHAALRRHRRQTGMVFQQHHLIGRLSVLHNVLMGRLTSVPTWRALLTLWSDADKLAALEALDRFGMADFASQRCDQLSGGQQQRVAICRALVQEPKIILADEPIASLDPRNTQLVMDALRSINKELGITVLCNLHALDVARSYCDRLVGMSAGRVVFDGAPDALTEDLVHTLYGIEATEVSAGTAPQSSAVGVVLPFARHA